MIAAKQALNLSVADSSIPGELAAGREGVCDKYKR